MALRVAYGVLLFFLLILLCDQINGARDAAKDSYESAYDTKENLEDQSGYALGYAAAYRTQKDATHSSYESADGTKKNLKDQSGYASDYAAVYRTENDVKDSGIYKSAYGTKENLKDQSSYASGYAAAYRIQKDAKDSSYESAYNTKDNSKEQSSYTSSYAAAYQTQKNAKDSSYISAYGTKKNLEDRLDYASGYAAAYQTRKDAKDSSYESTYVTKKNLDDQSGYTAAYHTRKDAKVSGYISAYGTRDLDAKYTEMEDIPKNRANGLEVVANQKDMNEPYIAGYAGRRANYIAAYRTRSQDEEDTYLAKYGTKEDSKASGTRNKNQQNHAHGMNDAAEKHLKTEVDNQKEMNEQYTAGYRNKQYIAGYRNREYIAGYRARQDAKDNSITAKEALKNSGMQQKKEHCGQIANDVKDVADQNLQEVEVAQEKEMKQPYIAGYTNKQYEAGYGNRQYDAGYRNRQYDAGYKSRKYVAGYRTRQDAKDSYIAGYTGKSQNSPYIAGYKSAQDVKELNYISAYGDGKDSKESDMVHENHMTAKPSSHMDRSEAFKSGFFTMDDLYVGKTMPLRFPIQEFPHFLPREEAESIPFSMAQLSNVLQLYSIPPGSPSAQAMEGTLQQCESLPIKGEIKHCATSLESMLGFVHNIMGSWANLDVLTITQPTVATVSTQNYSVLRVSEEIYAPKWIACHPLPYPYKVFYCHFIERSKIFKVLLGGENEHKVEAVAVCHMDTSDWDPNHILFRQLGIKPGSSSPVCHFLPVYHLVWVPSPTPATASI